MGWLMVMTMRQSQGRACREMMDDRIRRIACDYDDEHVPDRRHHHIQ